MRSTETGFICIFSIQYLIISNISSTFLNLPSFLSLNIPNGGLCRLHLSFNIAPTISLIGFGAIFAATEITPLPPKHIIRSVRNRHLRQT